MTGPKKTSDYVRERHDRLIRELVHDPYMSKRKLSEPTVCPECGAVFHRGHWQWADQPPEAHKVLCPACQRIQEQVPAGFLTLKGEFLDRHREEIMHLVRNVEQKEKAEHPLQRIMAIEQQPEETVITFTDPHLARGAGEAIFHAYEGDLDFEYEQGEYMLRVYWER